MRAVFDRVMSVVRFVATACFATMILMTLLQVVNRYALDWPIFWTEELIVFLLVWSMLLGMPVQLWRHEEIVVDVMPTENPKIEDAKHYLRLVASAAFCLVLAYAGWLYAERGAIAQSPALGLARFWFFVPIPISAALSFVALLLRPRAASVGGFD